MSKTMWMEAAGWHNADVTALIDAAVRPILIEAFGKVAGAEVRYSVNKRAAAITVGVAQTEVDRVTKAHTDRVKKSADKASAPPPEPGREASYRISEDGLYRWRVGMKDWERIPVSVTVLEEGVMPPEPGKAAAKPGRGRKAAAS